MTKWRPVFDGQGLGGWRHVGEGGFDLVDGVLRTRGGMGLLWYERERFGDCRLRVVYRTRREADNSGVFVRIDGEPADPWHAVHHGYEVQILATGDEWRRTGAVYTMSAVTSRPDRPPGEWNEMLVTLDGDRIGVEVNGTTVTDFDPAPPIERPRNEGEPERGPRPRAGYVGLQNHDADSIVEFREVAVAPLARG